jgi:hypothetical protein
MRDVELGSPEEVADHLNRHCRNKIPAQFYPVTPELVLQVDHKRPMYDTTDIASIISQLESRAKEQKRVARGEQKEYREWLDRRLKWLRQRESRLWKNSGYQKQLDKLADEFRIPREGFKSSEDCKTFLNALYALDAEVGESEEIKKWERELREAVMWGVVDGKEARDRLQTMWDDKFPSAHLENEAEKILALHSRRLRLTYSWVEVVKYHLFFRDRGREAGEIDRVLNGLMVQPQIGYEYDRHGNRVDCYLKVMPDTPRWVIEKQKKLLKYWRERLGFEPYRRRRRLVEKQPGLLRYQEWLRLQEARKRDEKEGVPRIILEIEAKKRKKARAKKQRQREAKLTEG